MNDSGHYFEQRPAEGPLQTAAGWTLRLGDVLTSAGIHPLSEVLLIRHTAQADGPGSEASTSSVAGAASLLAYTRQQDVVPLKFPKNPPPLWLVFMADGQRRSRFLVAYTNHGEVAAERTDLLRSYALKQSDALGSLRDRLVVDWSTDTINWAKHGSTGASFPVVEIASPRVEQFPGFDQLRLTHARMSQIVNDSRYGDWQTALSSVQGIYLIADSSSGRLYVGKADGNERLLGRWRAYAHDGHGGNTGLQQLLKANAGHARHFVYSILRVFSPAATPSEVNRAEAHYKQALLSQQFGLNNN